MGWSLVGAGAVILGTGIVLDFTVLSDTLSRYEEASAQKDLVAYHKERDTLAAQQWIVRSMGLGAIVIGSLGALFLLLGGAEETPPDPSTGELTGWFGPTSAGVLWHKSW